METSLEIRRRFNVDTGNIAAPRRVFLPVSGSSLGLVWIRKSTGSPPASLLTAAVVAGNKFPPGRLLLPRALPASLGKADLRQFAQSKLQHPKRLGLVTQGPR